MHNIELVFKNDCFSYILKLRLCILKYIPIWLYNLQIFIGM